MRKLNTILSVLLIVIFLLHGVLGSFMLLGVSSISGRVLAYIGMILLILHLCIGVRLTIQTFRTKSGWAYKKQNALFWTRRASGLAILILAFFHMGIFGSVEDGLYILTPFTTVKLLTQLLLVAALFVHLFVNVRPLLVSLGVITYKERRGDLFLILSILLLFMAGSIVLYYIRWQI